MIDDFIKSCSPGVVVVALLILVGFIMLLPLEHLFGQILIGDFRVEYISLSLKMIFLLLLALSLIRIFDLYSTSGLSHKLPWRFKYLNLLPFYLFILGILGVSSGKFSAVSYLDCYLLLISCLLVGFAEEFLFRGVIQSLVLKKYGLKDKGILISILISSVLFGLFHLINLIHNDSVGQVLVQVVIAMFIGFYFGALVLKTNRLIPIAIVHGLINFFFSLRELPGLLDQKTDINHVSIAPVIIFLPLLLGGIFIYKSIDKNSVIELLNMD